MDGELPARSNMSVSRNEFFKPLPVSQGEVQVGQHSVVRRYAVDTLGERADDGEVSSVVQPGDDVQGILKICHNEDYGRCDRPWTSGVTCLDDREIWETRAL